MTARKTEMPHDRPPGQVRLNEIAAEGRRLSAILADEMSEETLMKRACAIRGRSVLAVRRERDRVLRSPR